MFAGPAARTELGLDHTATGSGSGPGAGRASTSTEMPQADTRAQQLGGGVLYPDELTQRKT